MDKFKTIDDDPNMGLNNTICVSPVACCISKRIYLSKEDIEKKKCLHKPTVDMIGAFKCNWLKELKI